MMFRRILPRACTALPILASAALPILGCAALPILGCACADNGRELPSEPVRAPADMGQRAFGHVGKLVAFGPRYTGSVGWQNALDYITAQLRDMGLSPEKDTWTDAVENLTFTNISVTIPGSHKDKIVIGCHHDTKKATGHPDPDHNFHFVGANDSGSGVGLLLELARYLKDRKHRATYELVFFDGEESLPWKWDIKRALFGSRRYVRLYQQALLDDANHPVIQTFILLDMVGARDLQIDEDANSDLDLRDIFRRAAGVAGHDSYFFHTKETVTDDHVPFVEAKIRAIDLIDLHVNPEWHTKDDTLDHLAASSLHAVGEVVLTALPAIEARWFPAEKH